MAVGSNRDDIRQAEAELIRNVSSGVPGASYALAGHYFAQNRISDALVTLNKFAAQGNPEAYLTAAKYCISDNRMGPAEGYLRKAVEYRAPDAEVYLATFLAESKPAEAAELFENYAGSENVPTAYMDAARCYLRAGRANRAHVVGRAAIAAGVQDLDNDLFG